MAKLVAIAIGGSVGALFRYWIAGLGQRIFEGTFPVGTLTVNILGCFLMGVLGHALFGVYTIRLEYRDAILIGFLGAFTTYSTFGWETLKMVNDGDFWKASLYVMLSNVLGLLAVWIGYRLAFKLLGVSS